MAYFKEMEKLESLIENNKALIRTEKLDAVFLNEKEFPIWGLSLGSEAADAPVFALFGGVHGIERIGSQVVLTYLNALVNRLKWDQTYHSLLRKIKIIAIPIINPAGMFLNSRSNLNGIDLMRNAPQDTRVNSKFLVSGHRVSASLPWYRGEKDGEMEKESAALMAFCKKRLFGAPFFLSLDIHSGFGLNDRIWHPYACSLDHFPAYEQLEKITRTFEETYPYHIYQFEPQTDSYGIHGDLWDYLTLFHEAQTIAGKQGALIPLTLEIGSWNWVKKNPRQIFSKEGIFNPVKRHRYERAMRRHYQLLDFLLHATANHEYWSDLP